MSTWRYWRKTAAVHGAGTADRRLRVYASRVPFREPAFFRNSPDRAGVVEWRACFRSLSPDIRQVRLRK